MKAPRILFVGLRDDANLCNRAARAVNAFVGARVARVWTLTAHPYQYAEDMIGFDPPPEVAGEWDWLISTGDGDHQELARMVEAFDGRVRHVAMTHSGSAYRGNPHHYDRMDAVFGARLRFIGADSMHLAHALPPVAPWFSTCDTIVPALEPVDPGDRVVVAHSPSDRAKKGTDAILAKLEIERADVAKDRAEFSEWDGLPPEVVIDLIEGVPYAEARDRRARAHIFVDQLTSQIGGFGASAVEALAQGCAVLADIRNVPYEQTWERFGLEPPPIVEVRDADQMEEEIDRLVRIPDDLYITRCASLEWARNYATPEKFGRWFLSMLERHE